MKYVLTVAFLLTGQQVSAEGLQLGESALCVNVEQECGTFIVPPSRPEQGQLPEVARVVVFVRTSNIVVDVDGETFTVPVYEEIS
jgi:hypothetical protein